jgi:ABC-type branched-subunit amino acid transport system substrate-binding protein
VSAGFRAYLAQTDAAGGVSGRRIQAVGTGSEGALATVNTSLEVPIAPGGRRPLLEGPAAAGRLLAGQVFSFSAPPERLAYLAVDGLDLRGARVAVFTGSGVFAEVVPDAFATALRSQTSKVERVSGGGRPARWPEADLAVLALGGEDTRAWLEAARERGYSPRLGVSGIYNLADPSVVELLPEGSAVVSPYAAPQPGEAEAMREAAGGTPSFGFTHGWVTGKAVALAMWRSGAETPKQLAAALSNLTGEDLNGMIAPYSVRPGTNSRTPEGILSKVKDEKLVALGGFRGSGRT